MEDLLNSWLSEIMQTEMEDAARLLLEQKVPAELVAEQTGLTVEAVRQLAVGKTDSEQ